MYRLDMDKVFNKLLKLASAPGRDDGLKKKPESAGSAESFEKPLYSLLQDIPGAADDGQMLALCRAQVTDCCEDSFLAMRKEDCVFLGVFDGCGGSGGKTYASFGGHTGAWTASRAATIAAREWFAASVSEEDKARLDLAAYVDKSLQACKACEPAGQVLLGSLSKAFPTTVAAFTKGIDSDVATFYWCGDSRCYILDDDGLHQVTTDDTAVHDAMHNLREDAPMTNVASASHPFRIHKKRLEIKRPSLIFAATDGCFGYLPSPMAFERLLLETLAHSSGIEDWKRRLDAQIGRVSGDDYTLTAWPHRFDTFKAMKQAYRDRLAFLKRHYPRSASEEALLHQWQTYKKGYECMLTDDEIGPERG